MRILSRVSHYQRFSCREPGQINQLSICHEFSLATNSCGGGQCWPSLGMQMATWAMRDLDNQFRETDCKVGGNI